jgi:hypothetical protein
MIRELVASAQRGPSGAGVEAFERAREAETSLAGRDASWPSPRAWPRTGGIGASARPPPEGFDRSVSSSACQPPDRQRHLVGCSALQAVWRRIRTFDSQIPNLMLYPTELSVAQITGIEPATSGHKSGALPLSYIRWLPTSEAAPYAGPAMPPARAGRKPQPLCSLRHRDREARSYRLRQTVASGIVVAETRLFAAVAF